jgi:hypothetical protein
MSTAEIQQLVLAAVHVLQGGTSIAVFVLVLMAGFCVVVGFTKLKKTAGGSMVIKSLDEQITHQTMSYLAPGAPRGPADQLRAPELLEAAARK